MNLSSMSPRQRETASGEHDYYDLDRWQALADRLGARPSVGAMTIDLLFSLGCGPVSIFGFDFKRSLSYYMTSQHIGPHDYTAEEAYCMEMVRTNDWSFHSSHG